MEAPNDTDWHIPLKSYDLIDLLDKAYPPRCILPNESPEAAHRYSGQRQLIDDLIEVKAIEQAEAQEENLEGIDEHQKVFKPLE